ncbi:PREDICTED: uncharacterized protein LOC104777844 [Camelina sativa]|uniref:Uncharacterized protein LOC104742458 n=1 Tax=Camelina sativa TaxID=90675 RepID=A0ABM0X1U8_CAMSA|nr:PREDICTED: uncharacterized protein LOC104758232 [Camelina sativa]XP_019091409.1 PREDICTED: uncharacterized protein LOC104742458 [Camelina sativa]XP_019097542.1 PREDICTED: uncharacterized protein LOC104777844 [Camelina sativa]
MKQQHYLVVFLIVLFSFLLFVNLNEGRSGRGVAEEYWKKMMKDKPLPEPIKELLKNPFRTAQEMFIQDFDTKSVVLIYHNPNE